MQLSIRIVYLVSLIGIMLGVIVYKNPAWVIEIQRKFYEKINWRIVPISLERELRNTRRMGFMLIAIGLLALAYFFVNELILRN